MSIFSVKRNGTEIFAGRFLISPKLHLELNSAGYLEFDTTSGQAGYIEDVKTDTYTVFEDNSCIFAGRPTEITTKYNNKLHYYIEGAYGYFNDTVVAPLVYQSAIAFDKDGGAQMSAKQALQYIVNQHNSQVADNRKISISTKTKDVTGTVYRVFNFDKTIQCLSDLRDELGGLMYIEYVNEKPSLVWVSELETDTSQVVKLGKNILDLSRKIQCADLPSAVLPVGPTIQSTDSVDEVDDLHILTADTAHQYLVGQNLTLTNRTDVNNGSNVVKNQLYNSIGYQVEKVDFNDATSAQNLLALCNEYLTRKVLQTMFINIDVADLHYASGYDTEGIIHFATNLQVVAEKYTPPINTKLPVSSMDVELDNAIKKISIGTLQKNDLSSKLKKSTDTTDTNTNDIADNTNSIEDLQKQIDDFKDGGGGSVSFAYAPCGIAYIARQHWNPSNVPLNALNTQANGNSIDNFVAKSMTLYPKSIPCPLPEYANFSKNTGLSNLVWEGSVEFDVPGHTYSRTIRGHFLCSVQFTSERDCKIYVQDFHGASPSDRYIIRASVAEDPIPGSWYCTEDSLTVNATYVMRNSVS